MISQHPTPDTQHLSVTFLGTATSSGIPLIGCRCAVCRSTNPRNNRYRASILLQWSGRSVVVDTGPEFRLQCLRAGLEQLDAVLMTHEHADHLYGLDDVRFFTEKSGGAMPLYVEERTADAVRQSFPYIFAPKKVPGTFRPSVDIRLITGPFEVFGQTVVPIRVMHGNLPITGFRVGNFAYITDCSALPPASEAALQGLDTLVLGALRHKPHPTHFTLEEAVETAQRLAPRRTLFTHIGHDLEHEATNASLPPNFALAWDGLRVRVPAE